MMKYPSRIVFHLWSTLDRGIFILFAVLVLSGSLGMESARAATIVVDTTSDTFADDGQCSLREAIYSANFDSASWATPGECLDGSGADVITLAAGTYTLSIPGTGENLGMTGDLDVGGDLTINGVSSAATIIDGADLDRVFQVLAFTGPVTLTLEHLTVRDGDASGGAGIHNLGGTLNLDHVRVESNTGIGIYNEGNLSVTNSTISDNTSSGIDSNGGMGPQLTAVLVDTTINDNGDYGFAGANTSNSIIGGQISWNGGGVWASGNLNMADVAIGWNGTAVDGGGVLLSNNSVSSTITDCLFRGNTASGRGGGIYYYGLPAGSLVVTGGTIELNSAQDGGGLYIDAGVVYFDGVEVIDNSATNHGGGGYVGTLNDAGLSSLGGTIIGKSGNPNIADSDLVNGGLGGGLYVEGVLRASYTSIDFNTGEGIYNNEGFLDLVDMQVNGNTLEGIKSYKATGPLLAVNLNAVDIQDNGSWGISAQNVDLTLLGGMISGNDGGIYGSGTFAIRNATISDNHAMDDKRAGGLRLEVHDLPGSPDSVIYESTISGNTTAGPGGGLRFYGRENGSMWVKNVTISGNTATEHGGGIYFDPGSTGGIALNNVTVTNNTADSLGSDLYDGGGIHNSTGGTVYVAASILAGNQDLSTVGPTTSAPDCGGEIASSGYNLIGAENSTTCLISGSTTGNLSGTYLSPLSPSLAALADNGGATLTHALLPGSLAIDAGPPGGCYTPDGSPILNDQRGVSRPQGLKCDMGSFETEYPFGVFLPLILR